MTPDPTAGGDDAAGASDADDNVVVTICSDGQGGYTVYSGDEPESGAGDTGDMSEDDAAAMPGGGAPAGGMGGGAGGGMGGAPAPQGQPADSIGEALKLAMGIMQDAASSQGAPGDADSQFQAGFSGDKTPTPSMAQKY